MKKFSKVILSLSIIVLSVFSLCACENGEQEETAPTEPAKFTIGCIRDDDTTEAQQAYEGFIRAFSEKGYSEHDYYDITVVDCNNSKDKCKSAAEQFVKDKVDLIYTFGEQSTLAAKKATKDIPIIFCGVADPIEAGVMKSCEKPDGNITGVSDFAPVKGQFEFIKKVLPDAKSVNALYMSTDANSILISTLAKEEAEGLDIEYSSFAVADEKQLKKVLPDIFEDTDALYLCEDEITLENADIIIKAANEANIPIFATTKSFMSFGTFATCLPDYEDLGFNAGELALICLKELHPISNISVEYPVKCIGYVSESVANNLGIKVEESDSLLLLK